MTTHAHGTFDVKMTPQPNEAGENGVPGRLLLDKQFHGDLQGVSHGQMLTALTTVPESAGYVAIERVTGTLHGRNGSFALQHTGILTRGAQQLSISVVPDSGTGELVGLVGSMSLEFEGDKHLYNFEYTLSQDAL